MMLMLMMLVMMRMLVRKKSRFIALYLFDNSSIILKGLMNKTG